MKYMPEAWNKCVTCSKYMQATGRGINSHLRLRLARLDRRIRCFQQLMLEACEVDDVTHVELHKTQHTLCHTLTLVVSLLRTGDESRERGKHRGQARTQASDELPRDREK